MLVSLIAAFSVMNASSEYSCDVDAVTGEAAEILQVANTPDGEAAI